VVGLAHHGLEELLQPQEPVVGITVALSRRRRQDKTTSRTSRSDPAPNTSRCAPTWEQDVVRAEGVFEGLAAQQIPTLHWQTDPELLDEVWMEEPGPYCNQAFTLGTPGE
jgi:hypothetical protein